MGRAPRPRKVCATPETPRAAGVIDCALGGSPGPLVTADRGCDAPGVKGSPPAAGIRSRRRTAPALRVLVVALLMSAGGCGAEDVDAPATPSLDHCPPLDAYLADLYALIDAGGIDDLAHVVSEDLDDDARADLVVAIVAAVDALAPGTFVTLGALADAADVQAGGLEDTLAAALRVVASEGPGAPHAAALGAIRGVLDTCEGPPVLQLLLDLLADEALRSALGAVLASESPALGGVAIDLSDAATVDAVRALALDILVALAGGEVDAALLIDLLGVLLDTEQAPVDALVATADDLLGAGPSRDTIEDLSACLLLVDPGLELLEPLVEVLILVELPPVAEAGAALELPSGVEAALVALLELLRDDTATRRALTGLARALLAEPVAAGVLSDLATVLEAHVVADLGAALGALATRSCGP